MTTRLLSVGCSIRSVAAMIEDFLHLLLAGIHEGNPGSLVVVWAPVGSVTIDTIDAHIPHRKALGNVSMSIRITPRIPHHCINTEPPGFLRVSLSHAKLLSVGLEPVMVRV